MTCEGGPGSDQYNDLFNNFTGQLQTITDDFNNQISGLRNDISLLPRYPFSANNVNYVDASNATKNLQTYLKSVDSQLNSIPAQLENISIDLNNQIANLTTSVCRCDNIFINFTNKLNTLESTFNSKISTLEDAISLLPKFPLFANDMNYVDVSSTTKNLQTHLKFVDSQLNNIPTLLSSISSDYNGKISNINTSCQCTDMSSEITNQINTTSSTFSNQISALENKIPTLPIFATNVNYTNDNNITFLNDHVDDVSVLEIILISNTNEITTLKINIPTLALSATQANYTNINNCISTLDTYLKSTNTFRTQPGINLNIPAQELQKNQTTISNLSKSSSDYTFTYICS
jgi:septation ring formation regulator EzrA